MHTISDEWKYVGIWGDNGSFLMSRARPHNPNRLCTGPTIVKSSYVRFCMDESVRTRLGRAFGSASTYLARVLSSFGHFCTQKQTQAIVDMQMAWSKQGLAEQNPHPTSPSGCAGRLDAARLGWHGPIRALANSFTCSTKVEVVWGLLLTFFLSQTWETSSLMCPHEPLIWDPLDG